MAVEQIEAEAASWAARADRGLDEQEQDALETWLAQSPLHRVAYLRLMASWRRADRLAALKVPGLRRRPQSQRSLRLALAGIAAVLVLGTGFVFWRMQAPQAYETAVGETRAVRLADGSSMELNTGTRVTADIARRQVTLNSGEVYFDVVHDAAHPFIVLAGNRRITDIGTKFSVFRNGNDVRVTVREGKVRVEALDGQGGDPVMVPAGREVIAAGGESLVVQRPGREIEDSLAWRDGMLVFDQQPLAEVVEQFNRYNDRHIQLKPDAGRIRIGGRFKAHNVEGFVQLLHRGFGLSVSEEDGRIMVSR